MPSAMADLRFSKPFSNPAISKGSYVRMYWCLSALPDDDRSVFVSLNNTMTLPKYDISEIRMIRLSKKIYILKKKKSCNDPISTHLVLKTENQSNT